MITTKFAKPVIKQLIEGKERKDIEKKLKSDFPFLDDESRNSNLNLLFKYGYVIDQQDIVNNKLISVIKNIQLPKESQDSSKNEKLCEEIEFQVREGKTRIFLKSDDSYNLKTAQESITNNFSHFEISHLDIRHAKLAEHLYSLMQHDSSCIVFSNLSEYAGKDFLRIKTILDYQPATAFILPLMTSETDSDLKAWMDSYLSSESNVLIELSNYDICDRLTSPNSFIPKDKPLRSSVFDHSASVEKVKVNLFENERSADTHQLQKHSNKTVASVLRSNRPSSSTTVVSSTPTKSARSSKTPPKKRPHSSSSVPAATRSSPRFQNKKQSDADATPPTKTLQQMCGLYKCLRLKYSHVSDGEFVWSVLNSKLESKLQIDFSCQDDMWVAEINLFSNKLKATEKSKG